MQYTNDIRWVQRFQNYKKASHRLEILVLLANKKELDYVKREALIQCFKYTQQLS